MKMKIAPGSLWIAYTLTSRDIVSSLMPESLTLTPCRILEDEAALVPSPKLLFNIYRVDAGPVMHGMRTDVMALGRHKKTGRMHLVILDCLTDTLQWNPVDGVMGANAYYPRTRPGSWRVRGGRKRHISLDTVRKRPRSIDWNFAVESNLACYYRGVDMPYEMTFDEDEIMQPVTELNIISHENTILPHLRSAKPSHVFCHDHPMTFDVTVPEGFRV